MDDSPIRTEAEPEAAPDEAPASEPAVAPAPSAGGGPTKEAVLDALRNVHDPELGINIVDLGLVYGVEVREGEVHVTYTLTTMGCPIGPLIEAQIAQFVQQIDGVQEVSAEMVLRPAWSPEMMSEEAKAALGLF